MSDILIAGAQYNDVPKILVPKVGGGFAEYSESGGGMPQIPLGIIRPDAELIQTYSSDVMLVEDGVAALPSYSTTAKTIVTGASLTPTITLDYANYNYYVLMRGLAIPIYNTATKVKGRCDYCATAYMHEVVEIPAGEIVAIDGSKTHTSRSVAVTAMGSVGRDLYWSSASAIAFVTNATYAPACGGQAPTISSGVMTVKAPNYTIRGSTTYMTQNAWNTMTDIRFQYRIEVWKAAKGNGTDGWQGTSMIRKVVECARTTNHDLS